MRIGAVGVPLHSGGKTQFMILKAEEKSWCHEFISLEYDVEKTIAEIYEAGLFELTPCYSREILGAGSEGNVIDEM